MQGRFDSGDALVKMGDHRLKCCLLIMFLAALPSCVSVGDSGATAGIAFFTDTAHNQIVIRQDEISVSGRVYALTDCSRDGVFCLSGIFRIEMSNDCHALYPKDATMREPVLVASDYHQKIYWLYYADSPQFIIEYKVPEGVTALFFAESPSTFRDFAADGNGNIDRLTQYRFAAQNPSFGCS